jgi:hypothetical protein
MRKKFQCVPWHNIFLLLDAGSCAVNDSHWATRQLLHFKERINLQALFKQYKTNKLKLSSHIQTQNIKNLKMLQWQEM